MRRGTHAATPARLDRAPRWSNGGQAPHRVSRAIIQRRGLILPIVLVIIGLLAVTMAGYTFFIRAESAGLTAHAEQQQARLAAESALEEVVATIRVARHNPSAWYDVPDRFRHALVGSSKYTRENDPVRQGGSRRDILNAGNPMDAWRFSVVAPLPDNNLDTFRYGITPESGKLNINIATQEQLLALFTKVLPPLGIDNALSLVEALLDWRDEDNDARPNGGENDWYNSLTPAYNAKNALFDTPEELLLVRHFNAIALWGEDVNRNGLLDPNEDDGEASWPAFDNADGVLNPGLAPYLTIWSREPDTTLENKPRANMRNGAALVAQLQVLYPNGEISPATMSFITQLASSGFNFGQLTSPAQLYTRGYVPPPQPQVGDDGEAGEPPASQQSGEPPPRQTSDEPPFEDEPSDEPPSSRPSDESRQRGSAPGKSAPKQARGPSSGPRGPGGPTSQPGAPPPGVLPDELLNSPVTPEELPYIMDGLTVRDPRQIGQTGIIGLININTASPSVLALIPGMTPEAVAGILAARATTPPEQLRTTGWPAATGAVETATFHAIAPYITTKAYQFHVEAVGYADHTKAARRFEWVIEMLGPLAQVKYQRELTGLGIAWPVDRDSIVTNKTGK